MSRLLVKSGTKCTILTLDLGLTPELRRNLDGVDIVALPCVNERFYLPYPSFGSLKSIMKLVQESDVVHIMGHWTIINALAYVAARILRKPYVVCPAGALPKFGRSNLLKTIYNLLIGCRIIRNASFCIAITNDEILHFKSYGVKRGRIIIIPNGIDAENFICDNVDAFRRKFDLGENPILLFVGRLNLIKGPDLLLRAFYNVRDKLKDYHLVIAGPDEGLLEGLKEFSAAHGIAERVHFIGFVGGTDKSQAYEASDLLVIPSRKEAMSIVALEAGIKGTPVLLTDQCGFDEIARAGGGMVVPATVDGIQEGLKALLSNPDKIKKMGENLKQYVTENYLWQEIVHKYINLYERILLENAN